MSLLQKKDVRGNGAGGPAAQRAVGERSAGTAGRAAPAAPPDPELVERPQRRRFSAAYKLRVLHEADGLSRPRGRKPADPFAVENAELQRRLTRTETELEKARRVIEVQGNVCALLGELFEPRGASETASTDS